MLFNGRFFGAVIYFILVVWSTLSGIIIIKTRYIRIYSQWDKCIEGWKALLIGIILTLFVGTQLLLFVIIVGAQIDHYIMYY
jgi:hypothetical protein